MIFQNLDVALDSLAALRADKNLADANLTRMVAIDAAFVGFTVGDNQIRLNPNEPIQSGTELLAVELTANGDAIEIAPPLVLQISTVSLDKEMANASIVGGAPWPPVGTLLIPRNARNTYMLSVSDFSATNDVCVRKEDRVKVSATGTIVVGEFVGPLGPEALRVYNRWDKKERRNSVEIRARKADECQQNPPIITMDKASRNIG